MGESLHPSSAFLLESALTVNGAGPRSGRLREHVHGRWLNFDVSLPAKWKLSSAFVQQFPAAVAI